MSKHSLRFRANTELLIIFTSLQYPCKEHDPLQIQSFSNAMLIFFFFKFWCISNSVLKGWYISKFGACNKAASSQSFSVRLLLLYFPVTNFKVFFSKGKVASIQIVVHCPSLKVVSRFHRCHYWNLSRSGNTVTKSRNL